MRRCLTERLFRNRFQSDSQVRQVLRTEAQQQHQQQRRRPTTNPKKRYIRGIHKGNFFRIKAPESPELSFQLPKLRNHANPSMRPFVEPPEHVPHGGESNHSASTAQEIVNPAETLAVSSQASENTSTTIMIDRQQLFREYWERARWWWKHNWTIVLINAGSVCSLLAFTRSDVLELRALSVAGTVSSLIFNLALPSDQRSWTPVVWSLTFMIVNGFKIYEILVERKAVVNLPKQHEDIYRLYFEPHGVTPKQFEYIMRRARTIRLNKGDVLVREGALMKRVFLVAQGHTRAHHLGRRLTAVSFTPEYHAAQQGGASGAWVGEMAFLEHFWNKCSSHANNITVDESQDKGEPLPQHRRGSHNPAMRAMYTIAAAQDNTVIFAWKHSEMEALLQKSSDLQAALTRAMSAAIIGKVINFTASRKAAASAKPSSWLGGLWPPPSQTHNTVPPIGWLDEVEDDEEDQPSKVKIDRKPTFALPEVG